MSFIRLIVHIIHLSHIFPHSPTEGHSSSFQTLTTRVITSNVATTRLVSLSLTLIHHHSPITSTHVPTYLYIAPAPAEARHNQSNNVKTWILQKKLWRNTLWTVLRTSVSTPQSHEQKSPSRSTASASMISVSMLPRLLSHQRKTPVLRHAAPHTSCMHSDIYFLLSTKRK